MNVLFACKFSPFLSPFTFITFSIFLVNYLAFEFCCYFHQRLLLVEFFFSAMRFFLMFINAVCGLFLTIKLFKSGKCFSSQLNFISHYKKMWFWEWIYRESWKSVCNCHYSKGAGDGEGFRKRISITSQHFASYFCLLLKLFSWQKMLLWPSFSFWVLG